MRSDGLAIMGPPQECFGTFPTPGMYIDDGLIVYFELIAF